MLRDKINVILLGLKILFNLFITYLIMYKGDAGFLIHGIGAFFIGGNYIVGLSSLANITVFYILALYNLTLNCKSLTKFKNNLLIFDLILVIINVVLSTFIACTRYQMPLQDAISKYIILSVGAATVYYMMSTFIIWVRAKMQNNPGKDIDLDINNNSFSFTGKIGRCSYLITKAVILFLFLMTVFILKYYDSEYVVILFALLLSLVFSVSLFAASKRLRDINWKQWLLIIWAIPVIGLCIGLPLLIINSKQDA